MRGCLRDHTSSSAGVTTCGPQCFWQIPGKQEHSCLSPATGCMPGAGPHGRQMPVARSSSCSFPPLSEFQMSGLTRRCGLETLRAREGMPHGAQAQGANFPAAFLCSENNPSLQRGRREWTARISRAPYILMSGCKFPIQSGRNLASRW